MSEQMQRVREFWDRPEGKTGKGVIIAMIIASLALLYIFGGAIVAALFAAISIVGEAIVLGGLCVIAFLLFLLVTNKRVHLLVSTIFKIAMKKLTGWVIPIDPIEILESHIRDLKKRLQQMVEAIGRLRGQKQKLAELIEKNEKDRENSLKQAAIAKGSSQNVAFMMKSRKAGRLKESTLTYQALFNKLEGLYKALVKCREVSGYMIEDMEDEVKQSKEKYEAMKASYNAFSAAKRVMNGDADESALYNQTMEFLANDFADKVGEIEEFMDASQSFVSSIDLEGGVYAADALDELAKLEHKPEQIFTEWMKKRGGVPDGELATLGTGPVRIADSTGAEPEEVSVDSFSDLFENNNQKHGS